MKKQRFLVSVAVLTVLLVLLTPSNLMWLKQLDIFEIFRDDDALDKAKQKEIVPVSSTTGVRSAQIHLVTKRGANYYRGSDLEKSGLFTIKANRIDGTAQLQRGEIRYGFLKDAKIVSKNGEYVPISTAPIFEGQEVFLPAEIVKEALFAPQEKARQVNRRLAEIKRMDAKEIAVYLSFLSKPIKGADVTHLYDSHLPGAPRDYRGGYHEGIDLYGKDTGIAIDRNTPVYAMADGLVVRADHDYKEMSPSERDRLLAIGKQNRVNGQTPEYILDKMRGRSVWIQHANGILARYVHLDRIASDIIPGTRVTKGQLLGYVGNSGTSGGAEHSDDELHLHLDIIVYDYWFWKKYSNAEKHKIIAEIFRDSVR